MRCRESRMIVPQANLDIPDNGSPKFALKVGDEFIRLLNDGAVRLSASVVGSNFG